MNDLCFDYSVSDARICRACGKKTLFDDLKKNHTSREGRESICKPCVSKKVGVWQRKNIHRKRVNQNRWNNNNKGKRSQTVKNWRQKDLSHARELNTNTYYKWKYGITLDDKREMWRVQEGKCAICKKMMTTAQDCHVDHNHTTGKVRALLCNHCNTGIGFLKEDINILQKAIQYLQLHN